MRGWGRLGAALLLATSPTTLFAQTVGGQTFEDRNGNGIWDAGEPALPAVNVLLFGQQSGGGGVNSSMPTDSLGAYSFSPGNGCYLLLPADPPGWRLSSARSDGFLPSPTYESPVGQPRFSRLDQGIAHLQAGAFRTTALGDSIARNFNLCGSAGAFWYTSQVQSRLSCVSPTTAFTLDQAAVLGQHTDDLLIDDSNDLNNVFRVFEIQPQLITLSAIGNDLLGVDPPGTPTQTQVNRAVAEILDSRQNLQEVLSALVSGVPGADLVLNTLYDNLAWNCYAGDTTTFHRQWLPIVDRILRDLAWGQSRRVSINEVAAEFAHEDQTGGCTGFDKLICRDFFQFDTIHPDNTGYTVVREKLWEAVGGATLGPQDALGRTSIPDADFGLLRRVRRLLPGAAEVRNGASVTTPEAAFSDQDGGAPARILLGGGSQEFRLSGFPDWFDEIQIVRVLAGVRFRTTGTVGDDSYRMEASVTGQFRPPPGFNYTTTNWNFYTPIVGGGGPNQPPENADFPTERVLATPNVALYREASATLTKNPVLPAGAAEYLWPAMSHPELATTVIRAATAPVSGTEGNDAYQIELDAAWLDLYGWEKPRPSEISGPGGEMDGLKLDWLPDGSLEVSFDEAPGAQRYNLYVGRLATLHGGAYDHGATAPAGPFCDAATVSAGTGRRAILLPASEVPGQDAYFLVTAHIDDVETPAGFRSDGTEIDRAQSTCR